MAEYRFGIHTTWGEEVYCYLQKKGFWGWKNIHNRYVGVSFEPDIKSKKEKALQNLKPVIERLITQGHTVY